MSRLEQQRFTISEVAADWHYLVHIANDTVAHYAANHYTSLFIITSDRMNTENKQTTLDYTQLKKQKKHPLLAMANNWTRGAAHRHTTAPIFLNPVA